MIGVFDSGIGGLNILNELVKNIPNYHYIYYGDSINNPYGDKSYDELIKITSNIVDNLRKRGCKLIVIACNTATVKCINALRDMYKDLVFVGVEPAIKVACDNNYKNTLVMATPGTISNEHTHLLVNKNIKKDQNIYLLPCKDLAHSIEINDINKIDNILKEIYNEYKDYNIDSIVLGCTHYLSIKNEIKKYFNVDLLDGMNGIINQVKRMIKENNIEETNSNVEILKNLS